MEPPCEHGGVTESDFAAAKNDLQLQWSRRVNTAEWDPPTLPLLAAPSLQWSRRVNTAEWC